MSSDIIQLNPYDICRGRNGWFWSHNQVPD